MKYLIANWKANPNFAQVQEFVRRFPTALAGESVTDKTVVVAAPAIFYAWLREAPPAGFTLALEDISTFAGGAYTGEITAQNLHGLEPGYVIVGHSERRREFGETNETVVAKAARAWSLGATAIICFDLDEAADLATRLAPYQDQKMILAYEPVSSISTSGPYAAPADSFPGASGDLRRQRQAGQRPSLRRNL